MVRYSVYNTVKHCKMGIEKSLISKGTNKTLHRIKNRVATFKYIRKGFLNPNKCLKENFFKSATQTFNCSKVFLTKASLNIQTYFLENSAISFSTECSAPRSIHCWECSKDSCEGNQKTGVICHLCREDWCSALIL